MKEQRLARVKVLAAFVLGAALMAGAAWVYMEVSGKAVVDRESYTEYQELAEKYGKLSEIGDIIQDSYLWEEDEEAALDQACRVLVSALGDPYSRYLTKDEVDAMRDSLSGNMIGVGILIDEDEDGNIVVRDVVEESPAASAGIKAGDVITVIDGDKVRSGEEASEALSGDPGSRVAITYERDGEETRVTLVRGEIYQSSVDSAVLEGNIGYIRINAFGEKTAEEFSEELSAMEEGQVSGVIIDIRGNTGGLLEEGVKVADLLLPEGTVTYTENRRGERRTYTSDSSCTNLALTVLVDGDTASTAEMLAAALKDSGRASVIGETTYGKGVIQETVVFDDGTGLTLTTKEFFSSSGERIHEKGVVPDVIVSGGFRGDRDRQLEAAIAEIGAIARKG